MPRHPLLLLALALAVILADLNPQQPGRGPAAAWADDDDDDRGDDDDDDDDAPLRRRPAPQPVVRVAPLPQLAPNEVIARGLSSADLRVLQDAGFRVLRRVALADGASLHRLRKPDRMSMQEARATVRDMGSANAADFNHFYRPGNAAPACSGADCPARQMIAWPADTSGCGGPVRIGMVDTGLNADHAVLKDARIAVHRIDRGKGARSDALHGTAVAALLVGRADSRSPGLVPQAELVAVDAFHKQREDERADAFALVEALDYLSAQQVDIVNLSLAGPPNEALRAQIQQMARQDIVLVAAAGNGGPAAKPAFPAAYEQVIAVTAVDRREQVYRRANRGKHIDLAAPGVNVWTAASISGARTKTGTSFAAPFVTAAAALLLQAEPQLTASQVRARLQLGARDLGKAGLDEVFGHGLVRPIPACTTPAGGPSRHGQAASAMPADGSGMR
ncbi:S8 family serine peptidase [Paracoccus sp. CPCC 101403]|uniref:S8 family serine peptidase n=1 Tax=Paracoccus broussonetiae TaxID=3075834 RepID=A0ABU3EDC0_9RHOB|nr:S8 family serine peptidase [Paracoccus sp. CPCC 101403]MDT1062236.1 S8 family serine peptidase [Paracoccus sp. CPCC 101403]